MQPITLKVTELIFVKKICSVIFKLLSVNPGMETGNADFVNGRLIGSIWELKYQTIVKLQQGWSTRQSFMDETVCRAAGSDQQKLQAQERNLIVKDLNLRSRMTRCILWK